MLSLPRMAVRRCRFSSPRLLLLSPISSDTGAPTVSGEGMNRHAARNPAAGDLLVGSSQVGGQAPDISLRLERGHAVVGQDVLVDQ